MSVYDAVAAAEAARAASELGQQIGATAERHGQLHAGINEEREAGVAVTREGYRLDASQRSLDAAEQALGAAAAALQSQGPAAAQPHLDAAQSHLTAGVAQGSGAPALRAENERRLAELEARGQAAAERITEGRRAFDIVDEFAESTWADIRGNGSESQAAADRAQEHWRLARQGNTMEAQEFYAAKQNLDSAAQELDYVNTLIEAILARLKELETARDSARGLLAEAERSIVAGQEFVRANDPDVGKAPEELLRQAAAQLSTAQAEAGQPKPDWLRLVAAATEADRLADEALAGARSEAEVMQKLRDQTTRLEQVATGEVNKIARYVNLHGEDISQGTMSDVRSLVQQFEQVKAQLAQAAQLAEEQRRAALERALATLKVVVDESNRVFQVANADVKYLDQLRGEMNSALAQARSALERAQSEALSGGGRTTRKQRERLAALLHSFEQIRLPITGEANIKQTTEVARRVAREASDLASDIDRHTRPPSSGTGPIIITGGWGSSGSWSSGGGGGDSSWGGSNRTGGSFGGGSSGGDFGGGSSGGGW